jgi:hypothetical protein
MYAGDWFYGSTLFNCNVWLSSMGFFDAARYDINRYLAVLIVLLVLYPLGFIAYAIISRLMRLKHGNQ